MFKKIILSFLCFGSFFFLLPKTEATEKITTIESFNLYNQKLQKIEGVLPSGINFNSEGTVNIENKKMIKVSSPQRQGYIYQDKVKPLKPNKINNIKVKVFNQQKFWKDLFLYETSNTYNKNIIYNIKYDYLFGNNQKYCSLYTIDNDKWQGYINGNNLRVLTCKKQNNFYIQTKKKYSYKNLNFTQKYHKLKPNQTYKVKYVWDNVIYSIYDKNDNWLGYI